MPIGIGRGFTALPAHPTERTGHVDGGSVDAGSERASREVRHAQSGEVATRKRAGQAGDARR